MVEYLSAMWALAADGDKRGIVFFAALYCLLLLSYSAVYQLRIMTWPSTTGVLVNRGARKVGGTHLVTSRQEYAASALYEYCVNGEHYQGSRVSPWVMIVSHNAKFLLDRQLARIRSNNDGGVAVFFNPRNPKKSFLVLPGKTGLAVTIALALLPILLYWFAYHA